MIEVRGKTFYAILKHLKDKYNFEFVENKKLSSLIINGMSMQHLAISILAILLQHQLKPRYTM